MLRVNFGLVLKLTAVMSSHLLPYLGHTLALAASTCGWCPFRPGKKSRGHCVNLANWKVCPLTNNTIIKTGYVLLTSCVEWQHKAKQLEVLPSDALCSKVKT